MKNIVNNLNEYLLENILINDFDVIYNDLFPNDVGDCLISRHDPSQANEITFIDGSAVGSLKVSYYMRSTDAGECRRILDLICDSVDNLAYTEDGNEIRFTTETLPSFVSVDDKEQVIYTATINAEYNRKGV